MRVVATKFFQDADIEYFCHELPEVNFWFPLCPEDLKSLKDVVDNNVDVFLGPPPSPDIIKSAIGSLKLIQIPWSGVDGMDFSFCSKHSITCANSHSSSISVAELAVTLCLDVLKATPFHHMKFLKGYWHRPGSSEGFYPPNLLSGKRVGILGFGAIGREIHRLLASFNLDFATLSNSGVKNNLIRTFDRKTQFFEFLARSEILFVTAPLTVETKNILNHLSLSHMQNTSIIINVSRAELIDISALHKFLTKKKIAGVALDVHWKNLSAKNQILADEICCMQNVVMSPHRGGFVKGELLHLKGAIDNIRHIARGHFDKIVGIIDFDKGY